LDTKFKCYEWPLGTWSYGSSLASLSDGCLAYLSSSIWCSNICKDICWFDAGALPFRIHQNVCACGLFAFHSQWLMRNQSLESTENLADEKSIPAFNWKPGECSTTRLPNHWFQLLFVSQIKEFCLSEKFFKDALILLELTCFDHVMKLNAITMLLYAVFFTRSVMPTFLKKKKNSGVAH